MRKSPLFALPFLLLATVPSLAEEWPDLSKPAKAIGGGEHDAAVVVGVENYFAVPGVPGAKANAGEWYDYLTETRGIPPQNVKLLTNADATREEILSSAGKAARQAASGGTLWFVFVGHGAPSADGKDGLLIGVDAQQKSESLQSRSVKRGELLKALTASSAGSIRVVLDACFSGRGPDGATIAPGLQPLVTVAAAGAMDPRVAVLTAAKGDQFAGSLPGANRPAFSYLLLGGLRGWAAGPDGKITAGSLLSYTKNALSATLRGRDQTPDLLGAEGASMGASAGETAPNLARLAKATASGGFQVTNLPSVPVVEAPKELSQTMSGIDFGSVDVDALEKYDAVATFEKGDGEAAEKARQWRDLAADAPKFADMAAKRAAQWESFAAQKEAAEAARQKRIEARDADWEKLGQLLTLGVVATKDKSDWTGKFLKAYLASPGLEPEMAKAMAAHTAAGPTRDALAKIALKAFTKEKKPARPASGKGGVQWVTIPGGEFTMGSNAGIEWPAHAVTIESFQMAKTEVTNKQYKACVAAGACHPAGATGAENQGDDQPVVNVSWNQATAFSEWVGGRLPSEAEWEYAARGAGQVQEFPWGDDEPTCRKAVTSDCKIGATESVCSKPAGSTRQGLCDMAGNVLEWVQDSYHRFYTGAPDDGSAWEIPKSEYDYRVNRGGAWNQAAKYSRSAARNYDYPIKQDINLGFRPVRDTTK